MAKRFLNAPDRETVSGYVEKLEEYAGLIGELQYDLAEALESYMDDTDDFLAEAGIRLEEASCERDTNELLYRELNAFRKELLHLLEYCKDNGFQLPRGKYVHYSRLDPDRYDQSPQDPFYIPDPDRHYRALEQDQMERLRMFEAATPMTTVERDALRDYVISQSGLDECRETRWLSFLCGMRTGDEESEEGMVRNGKTPG